MSQSSISNITDKVITYIRQWQSRPLDPVYFVTWIDGIIFKVRHQVGVINKTVYAAIGISNTGYKEVLGFWIYESELAASRW